MKRIRLRTVSVFALAGLSGALLLHTSQNVQLAEDRLAALKENIAQEQDTIRVLKAEWAYLNTPERIEKLSDQYLDLVPPAPDTMITTSSDVPLPPDPASQIQNAAFKPSSSSPPSSKPQPSEKDFRQMLKNVGKGGTP